MPAGLCASTLAGGGQAKLGVCGLEVCMHISQRGSVYRLEVLLLRHLAPTDVVLGGGTSVGLFLGPKAEEGLDWSDRLSHRAPGSHLRASEGN